ncbi:GIY-YIG nuclease family protein [Aeromonas sp. FDAARGOS 1409]|uniref:GIY-YIG nuclease family protein n=1 Tax=Aeromonas TaxID=642 RepID=UPI001C217AAB|nr:GIY-YIG nuclease family protein [Aeromonas sp. FDAARGOS 1409]QXC32227.1 GIY-YIG nuclease family protein [Aeromonas sp. FDAARGOS 1409]
MSEQLFSDLPAMDPVLFPYYVYVLIDPANSEVFYVGKGQGERVNSHWAEARRALDKGESSEGPKQTRLTQIANSGQEPVQLVVGRYETEVEALSVEATLINWMYGFDALTNLNRGYRNAFIRPFGNHAQLPGIDVPPRERSNDGEFSRQKVEALCKVGAYDFMTKISQRLENAGFAVRKFTEQEDRPYAPGESNGWLGLLVRIDGVDFIVMMSKTCLPSITVATTASTREFLRNGKIVFDGSVLLLGDAKNKKVQGEGRFRDFEPKLCFKTGEPEERIADLCSWFSRVSIVKY